MTSTTTSQRIFAQPIELGGEHLKTIFDTANALSVGFCISDMSQKTDNRNNKIMVPTIRQKLPLDIQAFGIMRGEHYVYVDKTPHIFRMVKEGRYYFLLRKYRRVSSLI